MELGKIRCRLGKRRSRELPAGMRGVWANPSGGARRPHPVRPPLALPARRRQHLSWKVRYRTFPWFFSQMNKLYRARSLLYRRQILQVNIRWKALDEIYKIYMLLHRSDVNISEKCRQFFSHYFAKISYFRIVLIEFCSDFDEIFSEVRRIF